MAWNRLLLLAFPPRSRRKSFYTLTKSQQLTSISYKAVLSFLVFLTSLLQYMVQRINHKKDLARIELILVRARKAAWGPKLIPTGGQRKVRVNLGDEHDEDGDVVGSKFLDMVVDEEGVFLVSVV